eukprot:TRINITY_DN10125_c0_g1_i1.p1 TRINITY_DN10125_c0_g1~~TRINITY_DN10125_c0_g1_i1.p1  ORF type:complete len:629 (-),score=157.66 TRINITY_DN10125_c0_g1_i1:11-1897(-)
MIIARSKWRTRRKIWNRKKLNGQACRMLSKSPLKGDDKFHNFINQYQALCKPKNVHIIDGSDAERDMLLSVLQDSGTLHKLTDDRPNSYLARSSPGDVARLESRTFICSDDPVDAGPTNRWKDPKKMRVVNEFIFDSCMANRTMYVIPFCMGPLSSNLSKLGVQITDSPYVALSMTIMTRAGKKVQRIIEESGNFVPCVHSIGHPLQPREKDVPWPSNAMKVLTHFPVTREIFSYGSGYGGNSLLGKKCLALRIASIIARDEGWLAEHMLILGLTNPEGKKIYIAAAFPSACGKTNLAMLTPTIPGWKVETVGDDIAWMKFGKDGKLYAINPEYGFFGVAPGTSVSSNPIAMDSIKSDTLFTNVALNTDTNDIWWEDMTKEVPPNLTDWKGNKNWKPSPETPLSAHPNSRFCVPISNCETIDPDYNSPNGVPISAIIFGGRRSDTIPLVAEAKSWNHGTFYGASLSSESTAASEVERGKLRYDPFAMLPFCGYNMADYFGHWINMGREDGTNKQLPKIFNVNWFQKENNKFLWPGFGENSRVLKWIFERVEEKVDARETAIGLMPYKEDLDIDDLGIDERVVDKLFEVNQNLWKKNIESIKENFESYGDRLPKELKEELDAVEQIINK